MLVANNQNLFLKTTSFCVASSIIFGPQVGVITGIANYIISKYFANGSAFVWFQKDHAISHLKISASAIPKLILSNSVFGFSVLVLSTYFCPVAAMALNNRKIYSSFFKSVVIIPFFEEIIYRGVLQEKIIKVVNCMQLNVSTYVKRIIAIVAQSFLMTVKCFSSLERILEFPFLFGMGCSLGYLKELTSDMWAPISFRIFLSGIIYARVAMLGG